MRKILLLSIVTAVCLCLFAGCCKDAPDADDDQMQPVKIKLGHVGHDHHLALFVAFDNAEKFSILTGLSLKCTEDRKFYELYDSQRKIADIEVVKVGGGSKMPTALAQGVIDVGFGGVAAVLAAVDAGAPVKLISPLHSKGDMFVAGKDLPVKDWPRFVSYARQSKKPVRIGYKNPVAVAKIVFEEALKHENLTFSSDLSKDDVDVHMINTKGGGKLNVALTGALVDGYVGNNPFPSLAVEKGIGRVVCDLEDLPPGTFRNHPCCCIAATDKVLAERKAAVEALLVLFARASEVINNDLDTAVSCAVRWIGTSPAVEKMSIPTSAYSMELSPQWLATMDKWVYAMDALGVFKGKLKGLEPKQVYELAFDTKCLKKAETALGK